MRHGKTARRGRARRGEGASLREDLLAAAERLLAKTGDEEAVSIRAIAQDVGVTPPAIYLHFPDKDALILEVCARRFADLERAIDAATAGIDDPLEALVAMGRAYVRFGVDHPEQYRILFMRRNATHTLDPDQLRETAAFGRAVAGVGRCIDAGALAPGDPIDTALELWAVVHGVASLLIGMPAFRWPDDFVDSVLTTYVRGLTSAAVTSS